MTDFHAPSIVTVEILNMAVRFHERPSVPGDFAEYVFSFNLQRVSPGVYEAILAHDAEKFRPSHQKALAGKMKAVGIKTVFFNRYRDDGRRYQVSIHADGRIERSDKNEP